MPNNRGDDWLAALGRELRRLRHDAGLSQERLAERIDYSRAYVATVETGHQKPSRPFLEAVEEALSAPGALVALHPGLRRQGRVLSLFTSGWGSQDSEALADLLDERAREVTSVDGLRLAHEWLLVDPPQVYELRAGRRVGERLLARVEARVDELRHLDDYVGGGDSLALVDRELRATLDVLRSGSYTEAAARRLLAAVGELCQLAGWTASDAGRFAEARRYYLAGVHAANAAGRRVLAGNLLSSLSYQVANVGDRRDAVMLARSAYRGAHAEATPRTRALLLDRVAWAHARAGDMQASERALGQADEAYDMVGPGDEDPTWVYWVDRGELDVMAGRCFTELGRPMRAEPVLRAALAGYDETRARETALYLSWLAETYVQAREVDAAAATATRALELSLGVNSARAGDRVRVVRELLTPYRDAPAVRAFDERYRAAVAG